MEYVWLTETGVTAEKSALQVTLKIARSDIIQ